MSAHLDYKVKQVPVPPMGDPEYVSSARVPKKHTLENNIRKHVRTAKL